jgi:hypothetical protein
MCFSSPKMPDPPAPPPLITPLEPPKMENPADKQRMNGRNKGTSSLRIDRTASRPDTGSGLNIPL